MNRTYKQIFGRDVVFSAELCYNGANGKPLPAGEPLVVCNLGGKGFALYLCNAMVKLAMYENLMKGFCIIALWMIK